MFGPEGTLRTPHQDPSKQPKTRFQERHYAQQMEAQPLEGPETGKRFYREQKKNSGRKSILNFQEATRITVRSVLRSVAAVKIKNEVDRGGNNHRGPNETNQKALQEQAPAANHEQRKTSKSRCFRYRDELERKKGHDGSGGSSEGKQKTLPDCFGGSVRGKNQIRRGLGRGTL